MESFILMDNKIMIFYRGPREDNRPPKGVTVSKSLRTTALYTHHYHCYSNGAAKATAATAGTAGITTATATPDIEDKARSKSDAAASNPDQVPWCSRQLR